MEDREKMIVDGISSYSLYFGAFDNMLQRLADEYNGKELDKAFSEEGIFKKDAFEDMLRTREEDAWKWAHSFRGRFGEELEKQCHKQAEPAIVAREARLRKAILPYIEEVLSVAMGKGLIPHIWAMAVDNGLTEGIYHSDGRWRYEELSELCEKDRKAISETAEDIYSIALFNLESRNLTKIPESYKDTKQMVINGEKTQRHKIFNPFPLGGGPKAVEEMITEDNYEDFPSREEGDLLLFIPFVVSRIDEAVYYLLAYSGEEYLEYINSLNVEKDWDTVNGEKYGTYKENTERR